MQNFNYHTHTYRCGHADNTMKDEDFVKELIDKGFNSIAFTDHAPSEDGIDNSIYMRMRCTEKEEYLNSIKSLKEKYKDIIEIKSGFEIEYLPDQEQNLFNLKDEVDVLVLGQHYVYSEDNKSIKKFRHHDFTDKDLIRYAEYIDMAMQKNIPDIVVHPDLYMLARETFGENEAKVAHIICKSAEKHDIPLEINLTDPFLYLIGRKSKISYPCKEFWNIVSNYNIRVLYGIDAHYKEQIRMYEESLKLANDLIGKKTIKKLNLIKKI